MSSQDQIAKALAAADHPVMVESEAHLQEVIKDWQACEVIGIDTEFVRERTWRADLGLVQVSDGQHVWLVDPLKTGPLTPLAALLGNDSIVKVLHAPSEDLDVLLYATGVVPRPLFDTQIACALLGQSLQMGYHKTVEWLLGIAVDKGQTRSNWCKRPLSPAQLHYAALDVCLLPIMYGKLHARLLELGREDWLREDCARMLNKALTPADPDQSWKRINGNGRLDGRSLAVLQSLAKWRDEEAERRNLARGFIVKDNALLTIANKQPDSLAALAALDVCHPRTLENHGPALLSAIGEVVRDGSTAKAQEILNPDQRKLLAEMRQLVLKKAQELSIEPALLAPKKELEMLILCPRDEPVPERFQGWRENIITRELLSLKDAFGGP